MLSNNNNDECDDDKNNDNILQDMSGTIESEELDIMLKGLFAMAGMEFDQQVYYPPCQNKFEVHIYVIILISSQQAGSSIFFE